MRDDEDDDRIREDRPERRPTRRRPARNDDEERRPPPPKKKGPMMALLLGCGGTLLLTLCVCCGVGGYFGYEFKRESDQLRTTSNNMKQIGLAFHNYHDVYMTFPPPATKTRDGKPGLSWRVAILPYVEEDALYKQFRLDEPWDSPNNKPLLQRRPKIYASPRHTDPTLTSLRVFTGKGAAFEATPDFRGQRIHNMTDGTSNTIMVAESEDGVPWTKPDELVYDKGRPLPRLHFHRGRALVLMGDGSVRSLRQDLPERTVRLLIERADGMVIPEWD